jgi:Fe2+ transport system protein FeoA
MKAIGLLGLDHNWVVGVIALCAQEIAIRKKLESLGITPGDQDFQKVAKSLADRIEQMGGKPPDILLSLARAYPSIRGKLVHWGYKIRLYDAEVRSIVENTVGLIETLFVEMSKRADIYQLAENFLTSGDSELMSKISNLDSTQRAKKVFTLIERYSLLDWSQPGYYEIREKIRRIIKLIIKSFKPEDIASLVDTMIQRFSTVIPELMMEILGEVGALSSVMNMLQEKNYTDWIVSRFVNSGSFDSAGVNARVIANIGPILSGSQIEQVFQAILENEQIRYSWSAQQHLINFVAMYGKRVNPNLLKKVREEFPPK